MKTLVLIWILFLIALPAAAQEERAAPLSGRYSFMVPAGWVASTTPVDENFQGLFPAESLTLTPAQAAFSGEFERLDTSDMTGEGIVSVVWPEGLLSSLGYDAMGFGEQLLAANQQGKTVEQVTLEVEAAQAVLYRLEDASGGHQRFLILQDSQGNMLLVVAFAPADRIAEIDAILETLEYYSLNQQTEPSVKVEILPDTAFLKIPAGWWLASMPDFRLVASDFTEKTFTAFQNSSLSEVEGVFILAFERDKSLFPPEAYDDDGVLRAEAVIEEFNLAGLIGEAPDFEGQIAVEAWENANDLTGLSLLLNRQDGLRGQIIIVDAGDQLLAVLVVTGEAAWEQHRETVAAVYDTIELK